VIFILTDAGCPVGLLVTRPSSLRHASDCICATSRPLLGRSSHGPDGPIRGGLRKEVCAPGGAHCVGASAVYNGPAFPGWRRSAHLGRASSAERAGASHTGVGPVPVRFGATDKHPCCCRNHLREARKYRAMDDGAATIMDLIPMSCMDLTVTQRPMSGIKEHARSD